MKKDQRRGRVIVTGHRNPDIDSIASATALAELRRRQNPDGPPIVAVCPGVLPERAAYLFNRFGVEAPPSVNDVYPRIGEITTESPVVSVGTPLLDAVKMLSASGLSRLPVVDGDGGFIGMLSPMNLLSRLLDTGDDSGGGLAGRRVYSSIALITRVIEAEALTVFEPEPEQEFMVYVAAMGIDSFETHLPPGSGRQLAIITGDRPEIHLRALQRGVRLLIVTGGKPVEPLILKEAEQQQVTILQTPLDSASVIRRLKFSVPVEYFGFAATVPVLSPDDRVAGVLSRVLAQPEDVMPVTENGRLIGVVFKSAVSSPPPSRVILVDHNEIDQSLPGVNELPVIEVVDHHRIGMAPTATPIRFTGDVVGSTCTLVAAMFRSAGESLTPGLAGVLLGGIVSDTLNLKSPTSAPLDRRMLEWLEKISGVSGKELMDELSRIDSPLASKSPEEVINSDRKNYVDGKFHFSLSQVEESNLELLHQRETELIEAMRETMNAGSLDFIGLLVTDAVRENSELLLIGDEEVIRLLPYTRIEGSRFALPGVLSRKKQLLPQVLAITAALNRER